VVIEHYNSTDTSIFMYGSWLTAFSSHDYLNAQFSVQAIP